MREIKFRTWDEKEKRFWFFTLDMALSRYGQRLNSWDVKVTNGEKTQYTGLKDKNDVEIYEGDVVEVKLVDGHENFEVYYSVDEVKFTLVDCNGDRWGLTHSNDIKVIGHIYEGR